MDGGPPSASARLTLDREAWAQRSRRMECCEPAASASIGQEGVIIRRHHHHRHYTPPPTAALLANPALPVIDYQAVPPRTPGLLRAQQPPTPTDTESLTHQRLPIPCLHRPTTAQFRYCSLCPQYPQGAWPGDRRTDLQQQPTTTVFHPHALPALMTSPQTPSPQWLARAR